LRETELEAKKDGKRYVSPAARIIGYASGLELLFAGDVQ
jgi:hypothetical protein